MASAASHGNVAVTDRRLDIVRRQNLMRTPVTIHAGCGRSAVSFHSLRMHAARVSGLRIHMALSASDFLGRRVVHQALHIFVAVNAAEHAAVDGVLQLGLIHKQAEFAAVRILGHGCIGMAGEAVGVLELVLRLNRTCQDKQR